jgi:hypothetical protein
VTSFTATDPEPEDQLAVIQNAPTFVFSDIDAGETVTVTAFVSIPGTATEDEYTLDATVEDVSADNHLGVVTSTIRVTGDVNAVHGPLS